MPLWLSGPKFASLLEGIKVAAMETLGSDAALTHLGKAEDRDGDYDVEHLPPLLEDEVRHSLYLKKLGLKFIYPNNDLNT